MTTIQPPPKFYAYLEAGEHSVGMRAAFDEGGPFGVVKRYGVPAIRAGCDALWVRSLMPPWDWLESWSDAARALTGAPVILYTNPDSLVASLANRLLDWALRTGSKIVLDAGAGLGAPPKAGEMGSPRLMVRERFKQEGVLLAVEPSLDKNDPWVYRDGLPLQTTCCCLTDSLWKLGTSFPGFLPQAPGLSGAWAFPNQIAPWTVPHIRICEPRVFDGTPPGSSYLDWARWYVRANVLVPHCRGVVWGTEAFMAEGGSLTVAQIRTLEGAST